MRLNDAELNHHLLVVAQEARRIDALMADGKALALASCLSKIAEATREAEWRLMRMADEQAIANQRRGAKFDWQNYDGSTCVGEPKV